MADRIISLIVLVLGAVALAYTFMSAYNPCPPCPTGALCLPQNIRCSNSTAPSWPSIAYNGNYYNLFGVIVGAVLILLSIYMYFKKE